MKKIQPKIWIPVIVVILLIVGLAGFFVWPREEKVPEITIPEEVTAPSGIVWNVSKGSIDPKVEKEITEIIFKDPNIIVQGEALKENGKLMSFESLKMRGNCAVLGYALRYEDTNEFVPTAGITLLLKKVNDKWEKIGSSVYDVDYSQCE